MKKKVGFLLMTIGQLYFAQANYVIKDGSKHFDAHITVQTCDDESCNGKGIVKLIDKKTNQLFQTFLSLEKLETQSGKQFFSETHRIVIDRRSLFIVPKNVERENYLSFDKIPNQIIFNNYKIQCSLVPIHELNIKTSNRYAYFDADKIEFPLLVRYYKEGDYFYPFGMSKPKTPGKAGKKKLSKYFKDEKFSLLDKENTAVLFSGEKLIWLINHRIDDRFKVTEKTKSVLKMVMIDDNV